MTMAAAGCKQGIILDRLWAAHLLPRPKEWKEAIILKKKTEKGQKSAQAEAQGETFYPLAIEAGGAVNERFREFLVTLASSSSPSPPER